MTDLVVKTNRLNSAIQNLSLVEIRIIQLAIIDARETGQGLSTDKPLRITAERYADAFKVNKKNAYAIIKEAEETLFNRRFSFIDESGNVVKSRWLSQVTYLDGDGAIEVIFTPAVVRGITRIDGAVDFFTSYLLSNTVHFKSAYSVRLYELLAQWKNNEKNNFKTPVFEINSFRDQLGLDEEQYTRMGDFKKRVLDLAVAEINEHSDLTAKYAQHKKGRVITGFSFEVKQKDATSKKKGANQVRDPNTGDMFDTLFASDKQRIAFAHKLARLPELAFMANGSLNDYQRFGEWIADELLTEKGQEFYRPYLEMVGFKRL